MRISDCSQSAFRNSQAIRNHEIRQSSFPTAPPTNRKNRSAARLRSKRRTRRTWIASWPKASSLALATRRQQLPAGSEIGNLSLLGYNPFEYFTGRAPMEAAAQGIKLGPEDWAIRCNLVTIEDQIMRDFTADHISTEEGTQLLDTAQETIAQRPEVSRCDPVHARRQLSQPAASGAARSSPALSRATPAPAPRTTSPTNRSSKTSRAARAATSSATS